MIHVSIGFLYLVWLVGTLIVLTLTTIMNRNINTAIDQSLTVFMFITSLTIAYFLGWL